MTQYEKILAARLDMTNWAIHFTRPYSDYTSAREPLIQILKDGLLRPGWSPRPPRGPTIYGPNPAVCFTEQPLWAFSQYLKVRGSTNWLSGYGVLIHKHDLYTEGALPAIYGLGTSRLLKEGEEGYQDGRRILDPSQLPLCEQYRYVAFAKRADEPIDWSHEREWRWSPASSHAIEDRFALAGWASSSRGLSKGRVHVLVRRAEDVKWLRQELVTWIGTLSLTHGEYLHRWVESLKSRVGVVCLEAVEANPKKYARLESWPANEPIPIAGDVGTEVTAASLFT